MFVLPLALLALPETVTKSVFLTEDIVHQMQHKLKWENNNELNKT